MTNRRSLGDLLHSATHRVPGVPEHHDHDPGHQGRSQPGATPERPPGDHRHHRPVNQGEPRVLVAWQKRIAAFAGRR